MIHLIQCLGAGLLIGIIFTVIRLPVPVPHGLGGILGLVGMFCGGIIGEKVIQLFMSYK